MGLVINAEMQSSPVGSRSRGEVAEAGVGDVESVDDPGDSSEAFLKLIIFFKPSIETWSLRICARRLKYLERNRELIIMTTYRFNHNKPSGS